MVRKVFLFVLVVTLALVLAVPAFAGGGRAGSTGVVYVTSQGLYYDTFVPNDPLPMEGPFQLLENGQTEFGPGDPGYLGGRWWVDLNDNGIQDAGDRFFHCPLLGPGRETPSKALLPAHRTRCADSGARCGRSRSTRDSCVLRSMLRSALRRRSDRTESRRA